MLAYTDLRKGILFVYEGQPYEVLDSSFLRMQQRKAVVQTKIKNLLTGKIIERNWQASDNFEEADIEKKEAVFIYSKPKRAPENGVEYWFHEAGNPKNRFALTSDTLGEQGMFLKPNTTVNTMLYNGNVINVNLPIKMAFEVIEAPPSIKGNTATGGTKTVVIEGGGKIAAPLFVNQGDVIRINTQTGEYVERVEKK